MTMSMQCVMQFIQNTWCLSKHFTCSSKTYSASDSIDHREVNFFRDLIFCCELLRKFQGAMQIVAVAETAVRICTCFSFPFQMNLNFVMILAYSLQTETKHFNRFSLIWEIHWKITGFACYFGNGLSFASFFISGMYVLPSMSF